MTKWLKDLVLCCLHASKLFFRVIPRINNNNNSNTIFNSNIFPYFFKVTFFPKVQNRNKK